MKLSNILTKDNEKINANLKCPELRIMERNSLQKMSKTHFKTQFVLKNH
jgi:hypothetical protein